MITARYVGRYPSEWCGLIPVVELPGSAPKVRNRGLNLFTGYPDFRCEGLAAAVAENCEPHHSTKSSAVELRYASGDVHTPFVIMRDDGTFTCC